MNTNKLFQLSRPYIVAVLFFMAVSFIFFSPLLEGKRLNMSDISSYKGMAVEIDQYREQTGEEALWTNRLFGGMPAYMISVNYKTNLFKHLHDLINFTPYPAGILLISLLSFYVLLLVFRVNPWLAIPGALAFAFTTHFFVYAAAGHTSKTVAVAYMPLVVAGVYMAYRRNLMLGSALTGISMAFLINASHPQIIYYGAILILLYLVFEVIHTARKKNWNYFVKASVFLLVAVVFGVGTSFGKLWSAYSYSKHSMRGGTELTTGQGNKREGLDFDYATSYSYGVGETATLLVPDAKGGSSIGELSENSRVYDFLRQKRVQNPKQIIKQVPLYHGNQLSTAGPFYFGAIAIFLAVLGLFLVRGEVKWWILAFTVLSVMLSWGRNFESFQRFFFEHFPLYNKFRDMKMILFITNLSVALLAVLALQKALLGEIDKTKKLNALKYALGITAGILLIFMIFPGIMGDFKGANDSRLGWPEELIDRLVADRKSLLIKGSLRSLLMVGLSGGAIWMFITKKIKFNHVIVAIAILFLIDYWPVNRRYLNKDHYVAKRKAEKPFQPSQADQFILQDTDPDYRVINLTVDIFNDNSTSYFHKNVGGYHGAKIQRYQDMIERHIQPEIKELVAVLRSGKMAKVDSVLQELDAFNMLNTRYFIINPKGRPVVNPYALGNAWFVHKAVMVDGADDEITKLKEIDPAGTAVVDRQFEGQLGSRQFATDTSASIVLKEYKPNYLQYQSNASSVQLAVFSEIYYPDGWKVFIDGKQADYFRANYILRAIIIPEGDHTIEFRFEPRQYVIGTKISFASSVMLFLFFIIVAFRNMKASVNEGEAGEGKKDPSPDPGGDTGQ
jgi:hypothetical protein